VFLPFKNNLTKRVFKILTGFAGLEINLLLKNKK
jgi:hypothetical protein